MIRKTISVQAHVSAVAAARLPLSAERGHRVAVERIAALARDAGLPEPAPQTRPIPEAVTPAVPPLQQLCAMGHARDAAQAALTASSGDLAQAARSLQQAASQAAAAKRKANAMSPEEKAAAKQANDERRNEAKTVQYSCTAV